MMQTDQARPGSAALPLRPETEATQCEAEASRSQGRSASTHAQPGSAELPLRPETEATQCEAEASRSQGRCAFSRRIVFASLLCALCFSSGMATSADTRRILVCADPAASETTRDACETILRSQPMLFGALQKTHEINGIMRVDDLQGDPADRAVWKRQALNHLVVVGTPDEGDVARRTQGFTFGINAKTREMYRLGVGRFTGDVGSVETTFNPYLYSNHFDDNPYSTLLVRLSGTTPVGVALAAEAFSQGMLNGMVLGSGAQRVETSLLDQTPSTEPPPNLPLSLSAGEAKYSMAGWSQCPENEYRACLDYGAAQEPRSIWRVKYLATGCLDDASGAAWIRSPHVMAWGNAVTIVEFVDNADPVKMYEGVRASVKPVAGKVAQAESFSVPMPVDGIVEKSLGRIVYWVQGRRLVMSSLPDWANVEIHDALEIPAPKP